MNAELIKAFPTTMRDDASKVVSVLPNALHHVGSFSVRVREEEILIPDRIYQDPAEIDVDCLTPTQIELLSCLLSRHHNGFVRERSLLSIVAINEDWVPPFVVQLVGEYVIEIVRIVRDNLHHLDHEVYRQFLLRNPTFYRTTQSRVASYWNCYHRGVPRKDYAGFQVLDFFDQLIDIPRS